MRRFGAARPVIPIGPEESAELKTAVMTPKARTMVTYLFNIVNIKCLFTDVEVEAA